MFDGWITWGNVFYLVGLIIITLGTIVSAKWRSLIKELGDVFRVLDESLKDGKIDDAEKQKIMKELIQAGYAGIRAVWFVKVK